MKVKMPCGGEVDLDREPLPTETTGMACSRGCFHELGDIAKAAVEAPLSPRDYLSAISDPMVLCAAVLALLLITLRFGWIQPDDAMREIVLFGKHLRVGQPQFLGHSWDATELTYGTFFLLVSACMIASRLKDRDRSKT